MYSIASILLALKFSSETMEKTEELAVEELIQVRRLDSFKKALETLATKLQILRSASSNDSPLCKFTMKMVLLLLNYIRSVRTRDWDTLGRWMSSDRSSFSSIEAHTLSSSPFMWP